MIKIFHGHKDRQPFASSFRACISRRWEELFFIFLFLLLGFQVFIFVADTEPVIASVGGAVAAFASFESFVVNRLAYAVVPFVLAPLAYLAVSGRRPQWSRGFLDFVGLYIVARMFIQLIGLNLLVFDSITPRFTLITELLFFLPYSLLVWGWVYWRLDAFAGAGDRTFFRVDCERDHPRPIDYLVASFSSVFSASISGIKGRCARARVLILVHGFFVYDLMGLTLSRAVALIQSK
jgi:hypothetical protein